MKPVMAGLALLALAGCAQTTAAPTSAPITDPSIAPSTAWFQSASTPAKRMPCFTIP